MTRERPDVPTLASILDQAPPNRFEPILADLWVVNSLLHKSLRRGDTEIAQRAALTFFKLKGSVIWRRFLVIAFEDVGIGSLDVLTIAASASDPAWRKQNGGDERVVLALARLMSEAPKDRGSDYIVSAGDHPSLVSEAKAIAKLSIEQKLAVVTDRALSLPHRAVAVGSIWPAGSAPNKTILGQLLAAFKSMSVLEELVHATEIAAARTREPITVMVPLIWSVANDGLGPVHSIQDFGVPVTSFIDDVGIYAFDMHTRLGREAIWSFANENKPVRDCLEDHVPRKRWRDAAYCAAFYVDASPVSRRLMWDQSQSLEAFGIERDLIVAGVPLEGHQRLIQAMRENLDHLNSLRCEAFLRSRPQSRSLEGVDGGIGINPDGSLNIWIPGTPPSRWFEARTSAGELRYVGIEYEVDGCPKAHANLMKFVIGAETEDSLANQPPGWIRDGISWRKQS